MQKIKKAKEMVCSPSKSE
uniref:Uncharacterized protein n=1 Tax=Anguilla anguilla TaxID=7936 RepID=A0A0E9U017_ANGAN